MKSNLVTSCVLGAALFLTGCSANAALEAQPGQAGTAGSSQPSESAASARATAATVAGAISKPELEAHLAGLTDGLDDPLQIVPLEDSEAGMQSAEQALEGAVIEPIDCGEKMSNNIAQARSKATGGVMGMGQADPFGSVLLLVVLGDPDEDTLRQSFDLDRDYLDQCSPMTVTVGETTVTLVSEELPQDLVGEESYALLATETSGDGQTTYSMAVTARSNGLMASAQSVGSSEPDGILQDKLAELAGQALEPAGQ